MPVAEAKEFDSMLAAFYTVDSQRRVRTIFTRLVSVNETLAMSLCTDLPYNKVAVGHVNVDEKLGLPP